MEMTYDRLNTDELRGSTQADYLVSLDADFRMEDGDSLVYQEPSFPIVELARSMLTWLNDPDRDDFVGLPPFGGHPDQLGCGPGRRGCPSWVRRGRAIPRRIGVRPLIW